MYKNKVPAAIGESLLRRHFLELVLDGSDTSHIMFTLSQCNGDRISLEDFQAISNELRSLGDDVIAALKISCYLLIPEKFFSTLIEGTKLTIAYHEEFLAQLVPLLAQNPVLPPVTRKATLATLRHLEKMYWPNLNYRKLSFSDGFNHIADGARTAGFNKEDLKVWGWRWLVNAFGENTNFCPTN